MYMYVARSDIYIYAYVYVCVCVCVYIHIYTNTYTPTHFPQVIVAKFVCHRLFANFFSHPYWSNFYFFLLPYIIIGVNGRFEFVPLDTICIILGKSEQDVFTRVKSTARSLKAALVNLGDSDS